MAIERVSAVAIFADIYTSPKLAVARRMSGPYVDCYTLPGGGEEKKETAYKAAKRELWEETGLTLLPNKLLNRLRKPIQFELSGQSIQLQLFYTWIGKSISDEYMLVWTEQNKMEPWYFRSLSWLRNTSDAGLFPKKVFDGVMQAAKRTGGRWIGDMTLYEYDFPHAGLHSAASLRRTLKSHQ